jgi:hypothetical protein
MQEARLSDGLPFLPTVSILGIGPKLAVVPDIETPVVTFIDRASDGHDGSVASIPRYHPCRRASLCRS